MCADARKIRDHLLAVVRTAIGEEGVERPLRDVARRADLGPVTRLRHLPTRGALLKGPLRTRFDEPTAKAGALEGAGSPEDALVSRLRDRVAWTTGYRGAIVLVAAAIEDTESTLRACAGLVVDGTALTNVPAVQGLEDCGLASDHHCGSHHVSGAGRSRSA
ncbi:TetR family transcriptional regulator [Streptomyces sp. NPDC026673]|uniref:TetR/AcrR family transcriptional regulator n=1 Tax=Streptomyces sp. NPDC026673 TaxID=3155724 RepID=UPI0033E9C1BA